MITDEADFAEGLSEGVELFSFGKFLAPKSPSSSPFNFKLRM